MFYLEVCVGLVGGRGRSSRDRPVSPPLDRPAGLFSSATARFNSRRAWK